MAVLSAPSASRAAKPRTSASKRVQNRAAYLFVTPFFIALIALVLLPLGYSAYLSLYREQIVGGVSFVGLENYITAFSDPKFLEGLGRVTTILLVQVPIMLALSLLFALIIDSDRLRASKFFRLAIFVPYAVPSVIATLMWGYLYGGEYGPIAQLGATLGLPTPDLLSQEWMLTSIMNIITWEFVGYNMIILYASLRTLPTEVFEAARMDGAGAFRVAWSIKIPAIRPALLLTLIFSIIGTFQVFNEPSLMYKIAPNVIGASYTPNLYAYNLAFVNQQVNYAAALAFFLGIVIMVVSFTVQNTIERRNQKAMG
nr:sugar ABC transporter permease [Mycetocola tolaasinivorans]